MAALLSKIDLETRFRALPEDEPVRKPVLRRLRTTDAPQVNAEGDELAATMAAPTTDTVANIIAERWIAHARAELRSRTGVAKVFVHGRSQAVRLPKEFRLQGDQVRVRHHGNAVLLEPMGTDVDAWFADLDRYIDVPFMEDGRQQPPMPESRVSFE